MNLQAELPSLKTHRQVFHPVPLATIRPEFDAQFELYLLVATRPHPRYLLYKSAEVPFTRQKQRELIENGVSTLFVLEQDVDEYLTYVDKTVGQLLASDKAAPEEKSRILYDATSSIIKSTFERPESPVLITTNKKLVTHTVSAIVAERTMFRTLVSLFALDYSLYTHSVHVAVLGAGLLLELGEWSVDDVHDITLGLLLHDIGKSKIPAEILRKPSRLTHHEAQRMAEHPLLGVRLMKQQQLTNAALEVIQGHHERLDGSGYPRRLTAESLSLPVRVCSVADVFDALTSHRAYKRAMTAYEAMRMILSTMCRELDKEIVELLVRQLGTSSTRQV